MLMMVCFIQVYAEATVVFPLIVAASFARAKKE